MQISIENNVLDKVDQHFNGLILFTQFQCFDTAQKCFGLLLRSSEFNQLYFADSALNLRWSSIMIKLCVFVLTAALDIVFTLMTIQFGTQRLIETQRNFVVPSNRLYIEIDNLIHVYQLVNILIGKFNQLTFSRSSSFHRCLLFCLFL